MDSPNTHCSDSQLSQYVRRDLPWRELAKIDGHLCKCVECGKRLGALSNVRRARALLRSIVRDNSHLSYEQIEALAEGKVSLTGPLQAHMNECHSCDTELREMRTFVSSFRAPTPRRSTTSWLESIRSWFERPLRMSAGLAAVVAVCVGLAVVERNETPGGASNAAAAHAVVVDSGQHAPSFQDCNARELAARSAEWYAMYERGDFEQLAEALRQPAQAGNTVAEATLGVLLAKGLGTEANPSAAKLWLRRAAARGDVCASQALAALN